MTRVDGIEKSANVFMRHEHHLGMWPRAGSAVSAVSAEPACACRVFPVLTCQPLDSTWLARVRLRFFTE